MIRPLRLSALRATLAVVILAGGCAKVIGIDQNEKRVQCVAEADCEPGLGCVNGSCVCVHDCGDAGTSGQDNESCEKSAPSPCLCDLADRPVNGTPRCDAACSSDGSCVLPPSCNGLLTKCGSLGGTNCCQSLPVLGGDFLRSCDDACQALCDGDHLYPAQLSTFSLDAFEVTVGRFRTFVSNYPGAKPQPGAGNNPNNPDDSGWDPAWDDFLPESAADLADSLTSTDDCSGPGSPMWSDDGFKDDRPINCVTWYVAQAFCIWDGGRLPTQTEWNYAAAGGDQQRYFPWSKDKDVVGPEYAVYQSEESSPTEPDAVGSHPAGAGRWGHHDLAGNVSEWVWDGFEACYSTPDACNDCGSTAGRDQKRTRGGAFINFETDITVESGGGSFGTNAKTAYGFRCARDLN